MRIAEREDSSVATGRAKYVTEKTTLHLPEDLKAAVKRTAAERGVPAVIVDTSALLASFDASEPNHDAVSAVLAPADGLVVSPYAVAELDYLVATRHGVEDEPAVLDELAGGARDLAAFDEEGLRRSRGVIASYRDQEIGS